MRISKSAQLMAMRSYKIKINSQAALLLIAAPGPLALPMYSRRRARRQVPLSMAIKNKN